MESIGNYQIYKKEMVFDTSKQFPQVIKLILFFIGFLDIVFGSIFLLVFFNKGLLDIGNIFVIFISWIGGLSCLMIAMQSKFKKLDTLLIIGLVMGITVGLFYLYAIVLTFLRL